MRAWLLKFWTDPAFFAAGCRSLLAFFAMAVQTGVIDLGKVGWYASIPAFAGALLIKAGDRNTPLIDQVKAATPEEMAELKAFLR